MLETRGPVSLAPSKRAPGATDLSCPARIEQAAGKHNLMKFATWKHAFSLFNLDLPILALIYHVILSSESPCLGNVNSSMTLPSLTLLHCGEPNCCS